MEPTNQRPKRGPAKKDDQAERARREREEREHDDELIDEAGRESFPASDPPAVSPTIQRRRALPRS